MKLSSLAFAAVACIAFVSSAVAEEKKVTVGEFNFVVSDPWKEAQNTGMMTKAILEHPVKEGKALEAKFYHFGTGQGGDVEANVKRWTGMFEGTPDVKKEELEFNGTKVVLLTITGTFLDGPPMGGPKTPKADYQMLAAILVGKDAPVFVRLVGPKGDTAAAAESFKKLSTSPFAK